jgi:hypothetical protein
MIAESEHLLTSTLQSVRDGPLSVSNPARAFHSSEKTFGRV